MNKYFRKAWSRNYIHNEQITGNYKHRISFQYGRSHKSLHKRFLEGMNRVNLVRGLVQVGKSPIPELLVL